MDANSVIATAIINPPKAHNQVSMTDVMENILADLRETLQPYVDDWEGKDGKPGLRATWERYQKDRPVLESEDHVAKATEFAKKIGARTGLIKAIDTARVPAQQPLKDGVAQIANAIANILKPMIEAEAGIRERLQKYADQQLKDKRAREFQAAQAAAAIAKQGTPEAITQAAAVIAESVKPIEAVHSDRGATMETRAPYKYKGISDFSLVPREYLCVDEKKVREAISKKGGVTAIDGLIIEQEAQVVLK